MRYLIVGDIHIDLHRRFEDTVKLLDFIVDVAVEEKVSKVLQLGDIYETKRPYQQEMRVIERWAKRLADNNIPLVMIVGNHDITGGTSAIGEFEELGIPGISVHDSPHIEDGIYMGHHGLSESKMGPLDFMLQGQMAMRDLIANNPASAYFLGHIHKPQILKKDPLVLHSGSIDRTDFGERGEEKFVWIYGSENKKIQAITLPLRPMIQVEFSVRGGKVVSSQSETPIEGAIVKVVYHGTANDLRGIDEAELRGRFSTAHALAIQYDIQKESKWSKESKKLVKEGVTVQDAFKTYVDRLTVEKELKEKILTKGQDIINESVD